MRISVPMATYNGERFIEEQLESVAAQTFPPYELVVCDDGSTDRTLEIVEWFAAEAPFRVRIERNATRLGYADNFLRAAELCEGDLIAFSDQDDVWLPQKLARCVGALGDPTVQLVIHSSVVVNDSLQPTGRIWPEEPAIGSGAIDPLFMPPGFAFLFCKRLLSLAEGVQRPSSRFGGPMSHDEWVYFLASACGGVVFLQERLALHRVHGSNTAGLPTAGTRAALAGAAAAGEETYAALAEVAVEYAGFLRRLNAENQDLRARLERSALAYDRLARFWRARAALHRVGAGPAARLAALARLLRHGAYRSRRGGALGRRALAKDAAVALAGKRLGRLARSTT
jgi:Glycosyl transferase family 2